VRLAKSNRQDWDSESGHPANPHPKTKVSPDFTFIMICPFCDIEFEDLARHLRDSGTRFRCSRVFTSAYKGYAAVCHRCGEELPGRTVEHAVNHAAVCDPEATETDEEMCPRVRGASKKRACNKDVRA